MVRRDVEFRVGSFVDSSRRRVLFCLLVWVLVLSGPLNGRATAANETWTHHATGIIFPSEICALNFGGIRTYEPESLGIHVAYSSGPFKVTVYLYNMGLSNIPDGGESSAVKNQFEMALKDIREMQKRGEYVSLKEGPETFITFKTGRGKQTGVLKTLEFAEAIPGMTREQTLNSYLFLTGYRNHFVKIRFTCLRSEHLCSKEFLDCFLLDFGELLK